MNPTLDDAVEVIRSIEWDLRKIGAHTALTGSVLYTGSSDKDIDIIIYHHNDKEPPNRDEVVKVLETHGFVLIRKTDEKYVNRDVYIFELGSCRIDILFLHG